MFGCEPEREIAGVMFDEKSYEPFVCAERRAMDAKRGLLGVVPIFVNEIETARLREIHLIGRNGKFAANRAPGLHVDLRSVKRSFVWHLDIIDAGIFQHASRHYFGLFPKLWFINKFLAQLGWIVRGETHQIFVDPEEL